MVIGSLVVDIHVPASLSLKDKRHVVKSLLDSVRGKFNVSAAEVDHLDSWQRATLAFVIVSNEKTFIDQVLAKLLDTIESEPRCVVISLEQEMI